MSLHDLSLVASKLLPWFVYPFSLALLLLVAALLARCAGRRRARLVAAALAVLLISSCGPLVRELARGLEWQYLPPEVLPAADLIVVLGGCTLPPLPPRRRIEVDKSADRLFLAAALYREGKAPGILVSGGRVDLTGVLVPESEAMASLLHELGVPREAILEEARSQNTYENAVEAWRLLEPRGIRRILLVTSALHMPRAVGLFQHQGFEVVPAATDFTVTELPAGLDVITLFHELAPDVETVSYATSVLHEYLGIAISRARGLME